MRVPSVTKRVALLASGALALAACDQATSPKGAAAVRFQLAASTSITSAASAAAAQLELSNVQLVVGHAALGNGDQFGCIDCQGEHADVPSVPTLVTLPPAGGTVDVVTEQVSAGHYGQAELALETPPSAALAALPGAAPGTTLRVTGRFNGVPFQLDLAILGAFRGSLDPALDLAATSTPTTATVLIRLPVRDWFFANGAALDPAKAADRALIEANIRASFLAVEAEGRTGEG